MSTEWLQPIQYHERRNGANGLHTTMRNGRYLARTRPLSSLSSGVHRQRSFSPKSHDRLSKFSAMAFGFFYVQCSPIAACRQWTSESRYRERVLTLHGWCARSRALWTKMKIFVLNANLYRRRFRLVFSLSLLPFSAFLHVHAPCAICSMCFGFANETPKSNEYARSGSTDKVERDRQLIDTPPRMERKCIRLDVWCDATIGQLKWNLKWWKYILRIYDWLVGEWLCSFGSY